MIKEAIEKILDIARPQVIEVDLRKYSDKPLHPVQESLISPITGVHTLTGLVDYLEANVDDLVKDKLMILVHRPECVILTSSLRGRFDKRYSYLIVDAELPDIPFGKYLKIEEFIITIQANFERTPEVESILSIVGNLRDEHVMTVGDDGISQSVAVRTGIAIVEEVAIPNPVMLQPYRTFLEVEQPESEFIFRMKRGGEGQLPACGVFEADAGAWKLKAIENIRDWLGQRIKDVKIIA